MIQVLKTLEKKTPEQKAYKLNLGRCSLDLTKRTFIVGILNVTPDSFYDGGKFLDENQAVSHVYKMINEGADIIDIGGQSTKPGSSSISEEEELNRVIPVIDKIANKINVPISVDTYNHKVAFEALKRGAAIINDITGLRGDEKMASVIAKHNAAVIIMHMKGTPKNMQDSPTYINLIEEIMSYLEGSIDIARKAGISSEKIIIDPGIGFGKTVEHNLKILKRLKEFKILNKPILIGPSRKSFIGKVLNLPKPEMRLFGTAAACAIAITNGANLIRVHDVREMKEVMDFVDAALRQG